MISNSNKDNTDIKLNTIKLSDLKLSIHLLGVLAIVIIFGRFLPVSLQSTFLAISMSLKEILLFVLPLVIFSCVFSCLLTLRGGSAVKLMLGLFGLVCVSNYLSTLIAYGIGNLSFMAVQNFMPSENLEATKNLMPLWQFELPKWISNDQALCLGFILGSFFSFFPNPLAYRFSRQSKKAISLFLEKGFIPVLPLFALGFILKMQYDGALGHILQSYLPLMFIILITYIVYLAALFAMASGFNFARWLEYLKNVFPVGLVAFSTLSSMATLPVTLKAAEKNTNDVDVARMVIPATVNIHMVGVGIAIPLMAFTVLASFGYELPSFSTYCHFALYFILAQFAVAAVPGGAIIVMIPILEAHLGFSAEMSALITMLYILFDPFVTVSNVLGNSALVIMVSKALGFKRKLVENSESEY